MATITYFHHDKKTKSVRDSKAADTYSDMDKTASAYFHKILEGLATPGDSAVNIWSGHRDEDSSKEHATGKTVDIQPAIKGKMRTFDANLDLAVAILRATVSNPNSNPEVHRTTQTAEQIAAKETPSYHVHWSLATKRPEEATVVIESKPGKGAAIMTTIIYRSALNELPPGRTLKRLSPRSSWAPFLATTLTVSDPKSHLGTSDEVGSPKAFSTAVQTTTRAKLSPAGSAIRSSAEYFGVALVETQIEMEHRTGAHTSGAILTALNTVLRRWVHGTRLTFPHDLVAPMLTGISERKAYDPEAAGRYERAKVLCDTAESLRCWIWRKRKEPYYPTKTIEAKSFFYSGQQTDNDDLQDKGFKGGNTDKRVVTPEMAIILTSPGEEGRNAVNVPNIVPRLSGPAAVVLAEHGWFDDFARTSMPIIMTAWGAAYLKTHATDPTAVLIQVVMSASYHMGSGTDKKHLVLPKEFAKTLNFPRVLILGTAVALHYSGAELTNREVLSLRDDDTATM